MGKIVVIKKQHLVLFFDIDNIFLISVIITLL